MPLTQVGRGGLSSNAVDASKLADDSIDSDHIANGEVTGAKIEDDVALGGNPTTTTQSSGNNTTRIATTAFVTTAINAIDQDAIVTPQAAQNNRTFSTGNNHAMVGTVTIADGQVFTLDGTAKLTIIG